MRESRMKLLDLTLPTAGENLALDEALLDQAELAEPPVEVLRLWEPASPMIVVGRGSRVAAEVHVERCAAAGIPILRRTSGGGAILTGPGCLMYAVVLSYELRPRLRSIDETHRFVLDTIAEALAPHVPGIGRQGISDLAVGAKKISGNSLRCKRRSMLYHGTLLYDFRLADIAEYLAEPPRQPRYREQRSHAAFVANLPIVGEGLRTALKNCWGADAPMEDWPRRRVAALAAEKYSRPEWNFRH